MDTIKIAWMFPDTLYLHGDRGNILALERFTKLYGVNPLIVQIDYTYTNFKPLDFDIIYFPPGEISSFPSMLEWLEPYREQLQCYINLGKTMLTIGTTISMFGKKIIRTDGTEIKGLGLLDIEAKENEEVYGDDIHFSTIINEKELEIIGNQIQMVDFKNYSENPLGVLIYGYGNNGQNREEGFRTLNSFYTNTLAPLLVCNPWFTIELIKIVASNKGISLIEPKFDMKLEKMSFDTKNEFIKTKVTRLTNCK